jgi:hypothetical protein
VETGQPQSPPKQERIDRRAWLPEIVRSGRAASRGPATETIALLARPRLSYMTRSELYVGGGWTAQ